MKYAELDKVIEDTEEFLSWLKVNREKLVTLPQFGYYGLSSTSYVNEYETDENGYKDYQKYDESASRSKLASIARVLGSCEKKYDSINFTLVKKFGSTFTLKFVTNRESVCRKVVKSTKLVQKREFVDVPGQYVTEEEVEWICDDPLLRTEA